MSDEIDTSEPTFTHYVKPRRGPRVMVADGVAMRDSVKWYREHQLQTGERLTVVGSDGARYTRGAYR